MRKRRTFSIRISLAEYPATTDLGNLRMWAVPPHSHRKGDEPELLRPWSAVDGKAGARREHGTVNVDGVPALTFGKEK